jgi:hypothetical protein
MRTILARNSILSVDAMGAIAFASVALCKSGKGSRTMRMTRRERLRLIAAMLVLSCASSGRLLASTIAENSESDLEIHKAILASLTASLDDKYLVVANESRGLGLDPEWLENHLPGKGAGLPNVGPMLAEYESRNIKGRSLTSLETPRVKLVNAQALTKMFAGDVVGGWKRFWAEYPGAAFMVRLSLPGYSPDKKWALVCYSRSRGSTAGEDLVFLLRLSAGSWVVEWSEIFLQT